jgi:hypothetical protein
MLLGLQQQMQQLVKQEQKRSLEVITLRSKVGTAPVARAMHPDSACGYSHAYRCKNSENSPPAVGSGASVAFTGCHGQISLVCHWQVLQ